MSFFLFDANLVGRLLKRSHVSLEYACGIAFKVEKALFNVGKFSDHGLLVERCCEVVRVNQRIVFRIGTAEFQMAPAFGPELTH